MVVLLVILTVIMFMLVGMIVRKEEVTFREKDASGRTPIFLSPEKSLHPINRDHERYYHPSHSWVLESEDEKALVGFDSFISFLSQSDLNIQDLPPIGSKVFQGSKIWSLNFAGRKIDQLAPVTGEIIDINPALNMEVKLPAASVEKSWILKIRPDSIKKEIKNLITDTQAALINETLRDRFVALASQGHYLNDGGVVDTACLQKMEKNEWNNFVDNFFPYQKDE